MTIVPSDRRYRAALPLLCLIAAAAYLVASRGLIANLAFADPDDPMRLQQVRDLIAGQSWFDVTQYRMNPPSGTPMHWSRLIDVPIAALILLLRPLLGPAQAELAAIVAVPLLTLAACMAASASLARRLLSPGAGLAAAALTPLTTSAIQQMRPLRIDHHGWQVVLCILIARMLLVRDPRRAGAAAGALAATWLTISLEGLPFAAAAGGLVALRWLADPQEGRQRFEAFALALGGTGLALFAGTRAGAAWTVPACDAVSPVHLAVYAVAMVGTPLATRLAGGTVRYRGIALLLLAGACGTVYASVGPGCVSGAFSALDPLVMRYWYANVPEGLPIWDQSFGVAGAAIGFPLVGLAGAVWRIARSQGATRPEWSGYAFLLLAATIATVFVQRSGAMANMLALPGGLVLMAAGFAHAQRLRRAVPRVLASTGAIVALMPTTPGLAVSAASTRAAVAASSECMTSANYATAAALPTGILFTDIDIGPGILAMTPHSVVASGHHRNQAGIRDVLAAFMGSATAAHAIIRRHHASYVVVCRDTAEMGVYRRAAPGGFWAALASGRTPGWLAPAPIAGSRLAVWKVIG